MDQSEFIVTYSKQEAEKAAREISLNIKSIFPKRISFLILFFTPQYNPIEITKTINLILAPKKVIGIQAPFVIYEEKILSKGIVACCINKEDLEIKEFFLKNKNRQEIELFLNSSLKELKKKGFYFLSFISEQIHPLHYLNSIRLSLGRILNFLGIGYMRKYSSSSPQIINNYLNNGLLNLAIKGLNIQSLKLKGYLPIGKPFSITKIIRSKNLIMEINNAPAIDIYRHYLEEKFDTFMKHRLFSFYPLGINDNHSINIISIIDCLEDGSLVYLGEIKKETSGYITFLDPTLLLNNIRLKLSNIENKSQGVALVINSLTRKKMLRDASENEIKTIRASLGNNFKIIGLYSDYSFFSTKKTGDINIETTDLLVATFQ